MKNPEEIRKPSYGEWVLTKIVEVEENITQRNAFVGNKIEEKDFLKLDISLVTVDPLYEYNNRPYRLSVIKGNPVLAHRLREKQEPVTHQNTEEEALRNAVEIHDEVLQRSNLLGKNIMVCMLVTRNVGERERIYPWELVGHPDGVQVSFVSNGKTIQSVATWDTATSALLGNPGFTADVVVPGTQDMFRIVRIGDEWHDIND
ncbi:hypothetical protein [Rhodococcus qingshengii]|uniref:hypothetical protein n=1 Tax=Rhodococcus qingshengii TaxID=334542 RepID=UPI0035D7DCD2